MKHLKGAVKMNITEKVGFEFKHSCCDAAENRYVCYSIHPPIKPVRDCACECLYLDDYINKIHLSMEYDAHNDRIIDLVFSGGDFEVHIIDDKVVSGASLSEQVKNELLCRVKAKLFQVKKEFGIEAKLAEYQSPESLRKGLDKL